MRRDNGRVLDRYAQGQKRGLTSEEGGFIVRQTSFARLEPSSDDFPRPIISGKKEQPTHVDQRWLLDHPRCLWPRRSLLKRGTRNSASPTPPCDQPDARVIETTGGPRQTLSLQTIGPHVGLRGATGVAALVAAALQSSVPMRTVTVQQARSATGLPRSSKRMPSSSRRSCPPSQTAT